MGVLQKNIKSINHVGSAIILSASVISFILKGQSSTEKIVRMKMLLRPSLKCPRRTSRIFIRNSILPWRWSSIKRRGLSSEPKCVVGFTKVRLTITGKYRGATHPIYSSRISVKAKETSNAFPIMKKNTSALPRMSSLQISEIKKVKKLKSRVSFALSTASSSWLLSLKNIVSNSAARPKAWVAKRSLTQRACLLGACLFEACQSCLVNYNEMERELSRIHYSPQGFWRGLPAVKKLAQEAGVSDDNAEIWLMRRAIWQIYMLETNFWCWISRCSSSSWSSFPSAREERLQDHGKS